MPRWVGGLEAGTYIAMKDISSIAKPIGSASGASPGSPDEKPPFDPPPTNKSGTNPRSSTTFTSPSTSRAPRNMTQGHNPEFTDLTRSLAALSGEKLEATEAALRRLRMQRVLNDGRGGN